MLDLFLSQHIVPSIEKDVALVDQYECMSNCGNEDGGADIDEYSFESDSATLSPCLSLMSYWFVVDLWIDLFS